MKLTPLRGGACGFDRVALADPVSASTARAPTKRAVPGELQYLRMT
jgi:hypothetical protein